MKLQPEEIAINLLEQLIAIPSFSREEDKTAVVLQGFFKQYDIPAERKGNNVWARNKYFKAAEFSSRHSASQYRLHTGSFSCRDH
jgi:hypothetical protein